MAVLKFQNGFNGTYEIGDQTLRIGMDGIKPYDMTFGAMAACMYATFLDQINARGIKVGDVEVYIDGQKRKEIPTTLEHVDVFMRVQSEAPEEVIKECMDGAMRDCSMIQTVMKVAVIDYSLEMM